MQGGGWNFALPVAASSFFVGVLCAANIPPWSVFIIFGISFIELKTRSLYFVFIFAFSLGVLRCMLQPHLPIIYTQNPFLYFAHATTTHFGVIKDASARALASGLILGGMGGFTPEWKQIFRATGTSHIVAVSGSNITILAEWIQAGLLSIHFFPRQRAVLLAVILFAFVCITGAPQSVVRAALMAGFCEIAKLTGRPALGLHALGAATIFIGLWNPQALFDIGFQLSAGATLGIIIAGKPTHNSLWVEALFTTVCATLCTLPLSIYYFGATSAIALIANILIVPLVPLLMAAAGWAYFVSFLPAIFSILALPAESVLRTALWVLQSLSQIPGSFIKFQAPLWAVLLWYGGVALWAWRHAARQIAPP